jgi:mRNA-degrading endonuclease toxin of MazEF toxin-antitoxin module
MSPLGPGRIFWAAFPGARGAGKKRPMIIASRRTDILRTGRLVAVVCSTDFEEPLLPTEVLLPSDPEGLCRTELRHATVAVCDWTVQFDALEIKETGGLVPAELLRKICAMAGLAYPAER